MVNDKGPWLNQSLMLEFVEITLEMKSPAYLQCSKDYWVESTFTEKKRKVWVAKSTHF